METDPIGRPIDWRKRYERMQSAFTELQTAADKVVTETDRIHDTRPWPSKYAAPYGAITDLRTLLAKQRGLK